VFAFNNTPAAALGGCAPIEIALGVPRRDPISLVLYADRPLTAGVPSDFRAHVTAVVEAFKDIRMEAVRARAARRRREHARAPATLPVFEIGDWVLVADTSKDPVTWNILAQVLAKESDFIYRVRPVSGSRTEIRRHILHIREFDDRHFAAPANLLDAAEHYRDVEYPVEDFIDLRRTGREFEVLVRWEGFPPSDDTWEPLKLMLKSMPSFTRDWFHAARKDPKFSSAPYPSLLAAASRAYTQLQ
jgi:hypothetical protein